jgi:NAD(P)H-dependent FMN reductase
MTRPIDVALVYGSARRGRFCDVVSKWAGEHIAGRETFALDRIDPAAAELTAAQTDADALAALKRRIGKAEAFVIVTPEYNHGYPAALKLLIDAVYDEWQAKPVAFVSYGGASGGIRAVEQLRLVFAELHAVTLRDGVSFPNAWTMFGPSGALKDPAAADAAMGIMLGRLAWWADALRQARGAQAYASAVA